MILVEIDVALARLNSALQRQGRPKLTAQELAARIGITPENLSRLRNGHFSAVKRSTLDALCRELACQTGDIFRWVPDKIPDKEN